MKKIKKQLFFLSERMRVAFLVKKEEWFYRLVIPEKYKPYVKKIKWLITFLSLALSLVAFSSALISFLVSLGFFLLGTFIENILFHYSPLYIQPLPDFDLENEKWLGMTYGHYIDPNTEEIYPMLGMFFNNEIYLRNVHRLLMEWNYGNLSDTEDNIQMSLIFQKNATYTFFVYPNSSRETAKDFFKNAEAERKQFSLTDVQMKHFLQLVMGKGCRMTNKIRLEEFIDLYRNKGFFFFELLLMQGNQPEAIPGLGVFKKKHLKVKNEEDLDRKDVEYITLKLFSLKESE
jgi:hypothetical protein